METPVSPKVLAGGAAGAASIVLVWILSLFKVEVPVEVGMAITTLLASGAAYMTRDRLRDAGQSAVEAPPDTPVASLAKVQAAKQ